MRVLKETLLEIVLSKGVEAFKIIPMDSETGIPLTLQSKTYSTFNNNNNTVVCVVK